MKNIALAFALTIALAPAAFAGKICATAQLSTDASPTQRCITLTDAGMSSMTEALGDLYFPQGVITTPATATAPAVYSPPTLPQILDKVIRHVWHRANFMIKRTAEDNAVKAVVPIQ